MVDKLLETEALRDGFPKINAAIDLANEANANHAATDKKADTAISTANEAKTTAETVRDQFDQVVAEAGESNPEIVQARGGEVNLNKRLEKVDSLLAQKEKDAFYNELVNHKSQRPMLTFIDDDTRIQSYTLYYQVAKEKNIPVSVAVITGDIGVEPNTITMAQFEEMKQSGLVEFMSHTVTHANLGNVSAEQAEIEMRDSKSWLESQGITADYIVYPYGGLSLEASRIVKKYYKGGFKTDTQNLNPPTTNYLVKRVSFDITLDELKSWVDDAVLNNKWLILASHAHYPEFDAQKMRDIIDYARTVSIDIVTAKEGMQAFGNLIEVGEYNTLTYGEMNAKGELKGKLSKVFNNTVNPNTSLYDYPKGDTFQHFSNSDATTYSLPTAGVVQTVRTEDNYYSFQRLYVYRSLKTYYRYWNGATNVWSDWTDDALSSFNTLSPNASITSFPLGKTLRHFNASNATTYSLPSSGVIETIRMTDDYYSSQVLYAYKSPNIHRRHWDAPNNQWSAWY